MNIFILDYNQEICARYHNDKHVVKMILESAQLLCSAHWMTESEAPYKLSHKNHPCSIWVRKSLTNYIWLLKLGLYLCKEYEHRYNKTHKSLQVLEWCVHNKPNIPNIGLTPFAIAMPDECKTGDAVTSYRKYYMTEKRSIANWKNREIPYWFK